MDADRHERSDRPASASRAAETFALRWATGAPPNLEEFLADRALAADDLCGVLRIDLRERWRRGERVSAESYLERFPQVATEDEAAIDLIFTEFLVREGRGEAGLADEFVARFPQHRELLTAQIAVHQAVGDLNHPTVVEPLHAPRPARDPNTTRTGDGMATWSQLPARPTSDARKHPASPANTGPNAPQPAIAFVAGTDQNFADDTQALLWRRLRGGALVLSLGWGVFFLEQIGVALTQVLSVHAAPYLISQGTAFLVAAGGFALLSRRPDLSLRKLRIVEAALFGVSSAHLAFSLHLVLQQYPMKVQMGANAALLYLVMIYIVFTCCLLFVYAMFVPNSWRRAWVLLALMAALPVAVISADALQYPALTQVLDPLILISLALLLAVLVAICTVGAQSIHALRKQVFAAKRLGQYRLRQLLGAGGMGEVYLAEHLLLKRPCAVKLISKRRAGNATSLARFEREVRVMAELTHSNNVEIYDYGRAEDGTFYYVMEYLRGLTLAQMVERYGPMPPARAVHALRQTCQALREAHARGLIHRDIKPGNIFAAERGNVYDVIKLLDFGLVKPVEDAQVNPLTEEGAIAGTPQFMSPEQVQGREADARSDIYSLGAVAYYLLTGQPPFASRVLLEVLSAHVSRPVAPPSQLRAEIGPELEAVILRCLAKQPTERFRTVEELDEALAACPLPDTWSPEDASAWWAGRITQVDLQNLPTLQSAPTVGDLL